MTNWIKVALLTHALAQCVVVEGRIRVALSRNGLRMSPMDRIDLHFKQLTMQDEIGRLRAAIVETVSPEGIEDDRPKD